MNTDPSNPSDPSLQNGIEGKWFTINLLLRKCIANFNKTFEIYRHVWVCDFWYRSSRNTYSYSHKSLVGTYTKLFYIDYSK